MTPRSRTLRTAVLYGLVLLPVSVAIAYLSIPWPRNTFADRWLASRAEGRPHVAPQTTITSSTPEPARGQHMVFMLQYVATDYAGAVRDGEILDEFEYREMLDFTTLLVEQHRSSRAPNEHTQRDLEKLRQMVVAKQPVSQVRSASLELVRTLTREHNLIAFPVLSPNLDLGAQLYRTSCTACHGPKGDGRGSLFALLDPKPTDFTDSTHMNTVAPYQLFQAVTLGVEGTSMPAFDLAFSDHERWSLAFHLMTLPSGPEPTLPRASEALTLEELSSNSNTELASVLETRTDPGSQDGGDRAKRVVQHYRERVPRLSAGEYLSITEKKLQQSLDAYLRRDPQTAVRLALDGYLLGFEPIEPYLTRSLKNDFETLLGDYRSRIDQGASKDEIELVGARLAQKLDEAETDLASFSGSEDPRRSDSKLASGYYFVQSFTILLREGMEAALLVGLLLALATSTGQRWTRRAILGGAFAGLVGGGVTWFFSEYVLGVSTLAREALEGITSLLAAAVLFTICLWLIHKVDVAHWRDTLRRKAEAAVGTRGRLSLALTAFLAVYREAFETVLFYQALWIPAENTPPTQWAILLGIVLGTVVLTVACLFLLRYGSRLPLKPFFTMTSLLLAVLCVTFAGYGVRALQLIGWLPQTRLGFDLRFPLLDLYPTVETTALQLAIVLSFVLGYVGFRYTSRPAV